VKGGADTNKENKEENTPLPIACEYGHKKK